MALKTLEARGDLVGELAERAKRVEELRKRISMLLEVISEAYSSSERLSKLVENLIKTHTPPPPPPSDSLGAASAELYDYEERLKKYFEELTETAETLRRLAELENRVSSKLRDLEKWALKIEPLSPYHASQARRVLEKARRVLDDIPLAAPRESLRELTAVYEEMAQAFRVSRSIYMNRVKELEGLVGSLRKLLDKARRVATLEDATTLDFVKRVLEEAEARLSEARAKAPDDSLDPLAIRKELEKAQEALREILSSSISETEAAFLREYGRIAKAYGGRSVPLHTLIDQLVRSTGIKREEIYSLLYTLSKKGLIKPLVKAS